MSFYSQLIPIRAANDDAMDIYRNAGRKAVALLDPFAIPAKAFLTGIQHDMGGKCDDTAYELSLYLGISNLTCGMLTIFLRDPKDVWQHLHFYNGILKFIPSLRSELDNIKPEKLSAIIQAVCICAYMHDY